MLRDIWEAKDLAESGDLAEGLNRISDILNDDPDRPEALFIAAFCLLKTERWAIACAILRRAAQLAPHVPQVWNNLGLCLAQLRKLSEARDCLERSLEIEPDQTAALNNLALVAVNEHQPAEAIRLADKSLALDPDQKDVQETRGYACLMLRKWQEGWKGYEHALNNSKWRMTRPLDAEPYWDGSPGKKVFIRGEQGVGDEILFGSILADAIKNCSEVVLECDRRLEGLFRRSFPQAKVWGSRFEKQRTWMVHDHEKVDAHCLIGSLGSFYRNSASDFPGTPYLVPDPERQAQWRLLLDKKPGLKVGLAWNAGVFNTFRHRRSFPLGTLKPLFDINGASFISLEYKDPRIEIKQSGLPITHWPRAVERVDIEETAALISQLDLLVCATTTAALIAGAVGVKALVLVPYRAHWNYSCPPNEDEGKMPWFSSLELFRQSTEDDWTAPVEKIKQRLAELCTAASRENSVVRLLDMDARPEQSGLSSGGNGNGAEKDQPSPQINLAKSKRSSAKAHLRVP